MVFRQNHPWWYFYVHIVHILPIVAAIPRLTIFSTRAHTLWDFTLWQSAGLHQSGLADVRDINLKTAVQFYLQLPWWRNVWCAAMGDPCWEPLQITLECLRAAMRAILHKFIQQILSYINRNYASGLLHWYLQLVDPPISNVMPVFSIVSLRKNRLKYKMWKDFPQIAFYSAPLALEWGCDAFLFYFITLLGPLSVWGGGWFSMNLEIQKRQIGGQKVIFSKCHYLFFLCFQMDQKPTTAENSY